MIKKMYLKTTVAVLIAVILLFPIYWMAVTSLKTDTEIYSKIPTFFPKVVTFEGYIDQFTQRAAAPMYITVLNSVTIAVLTMLISTALAVCTAYGLARFQLKVNKYIMLIFLVSQMMPVVLFLTPQFVIFKSMKLLDNLLAPVISTCVHAVPFGVLTLRPYFFSIPLELEDSALIDGCNMFTSFTRVMLPIAYPGVFVIAAFSFLWGWGNLMAPLTFIRSENLLPLTINLYKAIGQYGIKWNGLMAYAVIMTAPVLLIFLIIQKHLVSGLTAGAVKG